MIAIIVTGLKLIQEIYDIKEQLSENNSTGKRLCVRAKIFETFLNELQSKLKLDMNIRENNKNETSLEASVRCLINLLTELKEYLEKFLKQSGSFYRNTERFVFSVAYRNEIARDYASFNQRLTDCANNLMPNLALNFEEQRQLDAETLRIQVEMMSNEVVGELTDLRNNQTELKAYLTDLREVINENTNTLKDNQTQFQHFLSEFKTNGKENANTNDLILSHIVELEKKLELKKPLLMKDFKGIELVIYTVQEKVLSLIAENFLSFNTSITDVKELIKTLQANADKNDEVVIQHLKIVNDKVEKQASVSMKELNELKQLVREEQKGLIVELETKLQNLNLLSVEADLKLVKDLLGELLQLTNETSKDNQVLKDQLNELGKKIETKTLVSQKDLNDVKESLLGDQKSLFDVIEQTFGELDISSKIVEGNKIIVDKLDLILERIIGKAKLKAQEEVEVQRKKVEEEEEAQTERKRSIKALDEMPTELLHIILAFYTNSYKGLLQFSRLSKTCKEVSDLEVRRLHCDFTCERTLEGHSHYVRTLIQLGDGRIASGSEDSKIKIWNAATGACEQTLEGHRCSVRTLIQLGDGRIASGSEYSKIMIWNVATGACEQTLEGHYLVVCILIQLGDGRIASGSWDTRIKIWNVTTGACERTLEGHSNYVCTLIQLGDGRIASGSWDSRIKIWNVTTGVCERTLKGHSNYVCTLIQLGDGRIASGSWDSRIKIWNVTTGVCEQTLEGRSSVFARVCTLIQLGDGRIASGSEDSKIKIWNVATGACERILEGHSNYVCTLIQLNDGRIASGSEDRKIKIWKPVA